MRYILAIFLCLGTPLGAEPLQVLAIGDSILSWHKWTGRDIPTVMGDMIDAEVENDAVAGARFSNISGLGRAIGFDVRAQFRSGPWDIVLINGGANDFLSDCGCRACDAVLDGLIAPDLSGEVPALLAHIRTSGAEVLWMGYYATARSGQFTGCRPYLVEYDARLARLAAQTPGLTFADSEAAVARDNRSLFAFDGIHPSPKGARKIAGYLAQFVTQ